VNQFDTIGAITENIRALLEREGLHIARENYGDEKNAPSSLFPYAVLSYEGETFEYTHGQRPGYSEAGFSIKVALRNRDMRAITEDEQRWAHRIREALTVNALNTGRIGAFAPVSRVRTVSVKVERRGHVSLLGYDLAVRYR